MKRWGCAAVMTAAWIAGCGVSSPANPASPAMEISRSVSSAIQAGDTDTTHTFAVGVVQISQTTVEFCSGSLLAPNLVATARHCVSQISSSQIDCSQATFGALLPASTLFVTTDTVITQNGGFIPVAQGGIYVPTESKVCGDDIALLVLSQSINLPGGYPDGYVVPAISPPLTDPSRSKTITAIGYGIDTPTDDSGATAGTRRIKENVALACIPDDPTYTDCFSDPSAMQYMTAAEFVSGDETTCEGDSGSGVYDQVQFDAGKWVSYGVLSRGSVSADGLNCVQPIYTRFDAWGPLLSEAAAEAASRGGYALPSWATGVSISGDSGTAATDDGGQAAGSSSGGASSGAASGGTLTGSSSSGGGSSLAANGAVCTSDNVCASQNCVSFDQVHYYCAVACDAQNSCAPQFSCVDGNNGNDFCFPASSVGRGSSSGGGCAVAEPGTLADRRLSVLPWWLALLAAMGIARSARSRARGRRREPAILSGFGQLGASATCWGEAQASPRSPYRSEMGGTGARARLLLKS